MIDAEQENEMFLLFDFRFVRKSQHRIGTNRYYAILIGFDNKYTFTLHQYVHVIILLLKFIVLCAA